MKATLKEIDEDEYERQLTELYGTVSVCGMEFDSGRVLRELDPTAFRCALADEPCVIWVCAECDSETTDEDEANECCT